MTLNKNRIIAWTGALLALVLAWYLRGVIAYFLTAVIVSFIGAPLMRFFDRHLYIRGKKIPRGISAALVLLTFLGAITGFGFIVLPPLIEQLTAVSSISESQFLASFGEPVNDLKLKLEHLGIDSGYFTIEYLKSHMSEFFKLDHIGQVLGNILSGASSTAGWFFIVTFISFFLLKEKYLFYRVLHMATPVRYEPRMQRIMRNLNSMLGRYFRSLLLQVVVFGTYIYIGLSICGEKYALTVAIFSGLVNLISYIGPLLGLSFALFFSILSHIGASFYGIILPEMYQVAGVYAIAIMLDNFVTYPLIFSNSLKVHPLELFFVILSGAQLGGLGGMMVAAPLYTVLRILAKEFLSQFEVIQNITRNI